MDFIVGTFNTSNLYTLQFDPRQESISVRSISQALVGHSWLALSRDKKTLYCTSWGTPKSCIAAFKIPQDGGRLEFINSLPVDGRPGYVCCSASHVYSVGGATGNVFTIREDGGLENEVQTLDFVQQITENMSEKRGAVAHGDFGGLRHGAHSCDLSPDGKTLYVADIGRNCVWAYGVAPAESKHDARNGSYTNGTYIDKRLNHLTLDIKAIAPRAYDGPRHTWPHPNGKVLYSLQEHSSMVDAFLIVRDDQGIITELRLCGSGNILPEMETRTDFWADEVRLSSGPDASRPRYLYASTRGLNKATKGYVSVFEIDGEGLFVSEQAVDIWQTPTSGGIANAIEPAPWCQAPGAEHLQYLALTDSQEGTVSILSFDGKSLRQACITTLQEELSMPDEPRGGETRLIIEAATAVWL
ncbi:hypothetical protein VHEMI05659 [[Torrubiella] hemipterigena]|uniref:Muconate cycloisomerase 1 n=1 Tax=[Torrubiella] hemipterigena TaxID=1531966 RepID=A0A0A1TH67_9HYPO|nr:hypothetical protein VHEMI05659 [[Torrubiella] hemipterigena]